MIGFFIFNGVNSRDHGIYIESYPQSCHAPRRGTPYTVAGRNGSEVDEDGTYDNYTQPYNINVKEGNARRADLRSSDLAQWLTGEPGFLRLEDSFEPEYFRLARFAGPINIDQIMGRWGRAQIEFECQPERYLVSGEKPYNLRVNDTITNPTGRTAFPRLRVAGSGTVYVTVANNGETLCQIMCSLGSGKTIVLTARTIPCWTKTVTTPPGLCRGRLARLTTTCSPNCAKARPPSPLAAL